MKNKNIFKNIKDKIYNKEQCVCDSVYPYCSLCSAMCKERAKDREKIKKRQKFEAQRKYYQFKYGENI